MENYQKLEKIGEGKQFLWVSGLRQRSIAYQTFDSISQARMVSSTKPATSPMAAESSP